ncbi:MAG: glycosyltransferase family 2 protein [Candidatus Kerfeldbacteria bacterium]|nr:glycosyltransferase family 2 protein [Candidatus Kerfeldbacteria bacterium]
MAPRFSVVIPLYNEQESLEPLYQKLVGVLAPLGEFELIFIDDGSNDGSFGVVERLHAQDRRVRGVQLRRNFGKSAGLVTGFRLARGENVAMIDADLQDEPAEIPKLAAALDGADLVTGWKQVRNDPWTKRLPSAVFNGIARSMFHIQLRDLNSGLKVMRREVAQALEPYGEQHRFLPILAIQHGFVAKELPVEHHERKYGRSKYGWKRFIRGSFDLLTIGFLMRFRNRPLHLFGGIGALLFLVGFGISIYLSVIHFLGESIGQRPLLTFAVLLMLAGLQMLSTGLLAELLVHRSARQSYPIRRTLDSEEGGHD